jgi:multiple sugar transport system permease protein
MLNSHPMTTNPAPLWAERNFKYLILLPAIFFLLLISLFPAIYNLIVSFQHLTMLDQDTSFYGFTNYAKLLSASRFWQALLHTLIFTGVAVPIQIVLGLLMAHLFVDDLPGKRLFVALLVLPAMISPIVAGSSWRLMFDNHYGPINQILSWIAGERVKMLWTINPVLVYPTIIIVEVWQHTPFVFLLLLAALANVDRNLIDAAEIDGASRWTVFKRVTLPSIRPVLVVVVVIRALDMMRLFDIVWALTRGGPGGLTETVSIYAYLVGFEQFETSYTAAMAFVLIAVLSTLVILALRRVEMVR